ncbi:hypothetical protein, variant [Spizellomyces punctatus DAOM BR117]|uniref:Ubiquitin-like protease family profile domain-containing protein n=1 Tax=Spizellomyces punctatus (strain DAOM BR117) TaxID=645134 RepID=A0A0L0HRS3_SPIPD|nr:hypothetical protein, variant [Spizellomyces punctatus DAOM BR117]KND03823.1 hypothetical protein, variant [Spizellomyces punctatus DAOM BR117]|eukprot:XP_016611862.1 hypothetical protein, variant [Spizellomyces punctatus DAOM BR117]
MNQSGQKSKHFDTEVEDILDSEDEGKSGINGTQRRMQNISGKTSQGTKRTGIPIVVPSNERRKNAGDITDSSSRPKSSNFFGSYFSYASSPVSSPAPHSPFPLLERLVTSRDTKDKKDTKNRLNVNHIRGSQNLGARKRITSSENAPRLLFHNRPTSERETETEFVDVDDSGVALVEEDLVQSLFDRSFETIKPTITPHKEQAVAKQERPKTSRGRPSPATLVPPADSTFEESPQKPVRTPKITERMKPHAIVRVPSNLSQRIGDFPRLPLEYVIQDGNLVASNETEPVLKVHTDVKIRWASQTQIDIKGSSVRRFGYVQGVEISGVLIDSTEHERIYCFARKEDLDTFLPLFSRCPMGGVARQLSGRDVIQMVDFYNNAMALANPRKKRRMEAAISDNAKADGPMATRRSTRTRSQTSWNEELFRYPPQGKNSVSVRQEDYDRLDDGEFLNDVVIEFYLKHLMASLGDEVLRDQVHIFNSFFYEQLAHKDEASKKGGGDRSGYDRVKKWTSKIDIFKKRYIFIPINENMHWYLALIYNPGALLQPQLVDEELDDIIRPSPGTLSPEDSDVFAPDLPAEADVELDGNPDSTIEVLSSGPASDEIPEENEVVVVHSQDPQEHKLVVLKDSHEPVHVISSGESPKRKPKRTYKGKKALSENELREKEQRDIEKRKLRTTASLRQCNVIILDSLHGKHPAAISRLKGYLAKEAEAKLNVQIDPKAAQGIHAKVPLQTNHCDCGIYLLYYVEVFLRDPRKYLHLIFNRVANEDAWFALRDVKQKRSEIKKVMDALRHEFHLSKTQECIPEKSSTSANASSRSSSSSGGSAKGSSR